MKTRDPRFERLVRKLARSAMGSNRQMRREYRKRRVSPLRLGIADGGSQAWVLFFFVFVMVRVGVTEQSAMRMFAALGFLCLSYVLARTSAFVGRAFQGYERLALLAMPVADDVILKRALLRFFLSWPLLAFYFVCSYGLSAILRGILAQRWAVVLVCALLQGAVGFGTSVLVLRFAPRLLSPVVWFTSGLLAGLSIFLPASVVKVLWSVAMVTPMGWVSQVFLAVSGGGGPTGNFALMPALATIGLGIYFFGRMRLSLLAALESQTQDPYATGQLTLDDEQPDDSSARAASARNAQVSDFNWGPLRGTDWESAGWIQSIISRVLMSHELTLAEFMLAGDIGGWSKAWRVGALIALAGATLTVVLPQLPIWMPFLPLVFATLIATPVFGGIWPGFEGTITSGYTLPSYALYPIGFRNLSAVILKVCWTRILLWTPVLIGYSAALGWSFARNPSSGAIAGAETVLILFAIQPLAVTGHFSSRSNDTKQFRLGVVLFLVLVLMTAIGTAVASTFMFVSDRIAVKMISSGVICLLSFLTWAVYGLVYNRSSIDLLSVRPQG